MMQGKSIVALVVAVLLVLGVVGCSNSSKPVVKKVDLTKVDEQPSRVFYEIFVRSFADSNGDGIGDLNGVTAKLDYLKQLGVGGIWLMPINPSPSYHGYDVTDYYNVNPDYGTLDDFKNLMAEAKKRDIKIIMDLVVNHTSREHPWFQKALNNPKSKYRKWYSFEQSNADNVDHTGPWGNNIWHTVGDDMYLGVFWEGMPDLNFDNRAVRQEMKKIGQFWLKQGVDGFRLDAAKHIFGDFQSTIYTPKVQKKNVAWWEEFRTAMNKVNKDAYVVGEVWDSPQIVAPYLAKAFDSGFNFSMADAIINGLQNNNKPDLSLVLDEAYKNFRQTSQDQFVDAIFLANHDQDRVMSKFDNDANKARMAAAILLTLPGNTFLYYGEELGMQGKKPDEQIREPMPWNKVAGRANGQTDWEDSEYRAPGVSVEEQQASSNSMLQEYKKLISWRNTIPALNKGGINLVEAGSNSILAYVRETAKDGAVLVVHNVGTEAEVVNFGSTIPANAVLIRQSTDQVKLDGTNVTLPGYSTAIIDLMAVQ